MSTLSEGPLEQSATAKRAERLAHAQAMIEVRDVGKTFRIPHNRVDSLRERVTHPLRGREYRQLTALRGISFDVRRGEFFGIVGRNGSGKSTLLKIMASIYAPDRGEIRIAGRLAPFIELGVGFNPELTSRENVVLNGVLMGLSRREAARRLDSVLEFAELREFADLKLKNYSSGMMVRLAFAVMVEADADVMLIDEVLAVGDASFAQKCLQVFRERRDAGRTIVLVTHDMATVQSFCDRAMLIHDSEVQYIGEPDETALRYYRLNFGGDADEVRTPGALPEVNVRVIDAWLEDSSGTRVTNVEQGAAPVLQLRGRGPARAAQSAVRLSLHGRRRRPSVRLQQDARARGGRPGPPAPRRARAHLRRGGEPPPPRPLPRRLLDLPQPRGR